MTFLRKPQLEPFGDIFRLTQTAVYQDNTGKQWLIPKGMVTDFASVPRVAVWLLPKFGKWTDASLVHDWGCERGIREGLISPVGNDWLFLEIMQNAGVSWLARWLMWAGVRWGAAANPIRRPGWFADFWKLMGLTLIGLVILPPAAIGILWGQLVFGLIQWPTSALMDREATTTGVEIST